MYGFDKRKAWRAAWRYALRAVTPFALVLATIALTVGAERPVGGPVDRVLPVVSSLLFGAFVALLFASTTVFEAQAVHLYGSPLRAELARKVPVLTWLLGYARVTVQAEGEEVARQLWCFGMPWQLSRLDVGAQLDLVQDTRAAKGRRSLWLPFWVSAGATQAEIQEIGREIMSDLADVLRPLDGEFEEMDRRIESQGKLAGCGSVVFAIAVAVACGVGLGVGLLMTLVALAVAVHAVQRAYGGRRRRAVQAAVERFDERFPEGKHEREAALMMLNEEKSPTPAWAALRKALIG